MIGFTAPWVLAGLVAAAAPILLHLLARRDPPTVVFPAVRYLGQTAQHLRRRVSLRHWLLLVLRTLLIVALVLAAAGPTVAGRAGVGGGHAPAGLVLVLDNSASSGAIRNGAPTLDGLRLAAHRILESAGPEDDLVLLTADAVPRRGDVATLRGLIDSLVPSDRRVDLGAMVAVARETLAGGRRDGEVLVLSDLQATAVTRAPAGSPLLVGRPDGMPPWNMGVAGFSISPEPWTAEGGLVSVQLTVLPVDPRPLSIRLDGGPRRQLLVAGLETPSFRLVAPPGWHLLEAEIAPDELRADDVRRALVRVATPVAVAWDPADRYLATACEVLAANGRITPGSAVTVGRLGPGASVVLPPRDPSGLGAANRALAARGITWRFGALRIAAERTDSGRLIGAEAVHRRYALEPVGSIAPDVGVVVTVGKTPWAVRSGDVVLVGSRFEPGWTDLPVSAGFLPFLDALFNRVVRGEATRIEAAPGEPVFLPDRATTVTGVSGGEPEWRVEGGARWAPPAAGVYLVLAGRDTIGAVHAAIDPRESDLRPADDAVVRRLWPGAVIVDLDEAPNRVFAAGARADLRGPLLWLILAIAIAEAFLARGARESA